jgi:acetolactate synthase small subunit
MKNYTLTVDLMNKPGNIIRVALLFERRGHVIHYIEVLPSDHESKPAKMIIKAKGDSSKTEQIKKQLSKLIDVVQVKEVLADHKQEVFSKTAPAQMVAAV